MDFDGDLGALRAYEAVVELPRVSDLAAVARAVTIRAFESRGRDSDTSQVIRLSDEISLPRSEGDTEFGNVLDVLERGPDGDSQRNLACAMAALVLAYDPPMGREDEENTAERTLWLAANTAFDATGLLDRALGARASALWLAIAERIRRIDRDRICSSNRCLAIIGALALTSSATKEAQRELGSLRTVVRDPKVLRVLSISRPGELSSIKGELTSPPRGAFWTTILAFCGALFVVHAGRLFGRWALGYRRPVEMFLASNGEVRLSSRSEMLGRVLSRRELIVPHGGLAQIVRDVRYPKLAFYSGLLALSIGSYVGVSAFVDGARVLSPSLLATGLGIVVLGLGLDFAFSSLSQAAQGCSRLLIVPRTGSPICIGGVSIESTDAILLRLADR